MSYNIYGLGKFDRIQTILLGAVDTLVSNIYPKDDNLWSSATYVPFTDAEILAASNAEWVIRFIGCTDNAATITIEDIFGKSMRNLTPPLIDIGGGQRIYGTGGLTIDSFLKLTPQAAPPASVSEGMIYSDTDHHLYYYNGSTWVQLDN
ncbi:MAG: hypothetical protein BWY21_01456 [Parcubacteria group bacterium ADurb.Bin216]|nr:MAG: hypothetical protein BWY21_01456 [Parcubacteria group bacterium ADurb.Bin216]